VDLRSGLDEILQVRPREEVSQVHKLAVVGILDIDDSPAGLAATDGLAINDDSVLRTNDSKGNHCLENPGGSSAHRHFKSEVRYSYTDAFVNLDLLFLILIGIERIETDVVVNQLFPNLSSRAHQSAVQASPTPLKLTLLLNASLSSRVRLSALAMTGTTLTTSLSFFITITSMGRRLWPVGLMKYKQQWMRVSWM